VSKVFLVTVEGPFFLDIEIKFTYILYHVLHESPHYAAH